MRNPLSKALWTICLGVLGAGLFLLGYTLYNDEAGKTSAANITLTIAAIVGMTMAIFGLFGFLVTLFSAIGYARLMSGKGLIARWHVTADEWDRFRAFDEIRAAEHSSLINDVHIREQTPPQGVNVIVGRGHIIVDGSYHSISGLDAIGREINWLNAPVNPECIEFPKSYPRNKFGTVQFTLRVPVPASARAEGVRVFEHYRPNDNPILNPSPARVRRDGTIMLVLGFIILVPCGFLLALALGMPWPKFLLTASMRVEERPAELHFGGIAVSGFFAACGVLAVIMGLWQIIFRQRNMALLEIFTAMVAVLFVAGYLAQAWSVFQ
jgi:hypothetical protein